MKHNKRYQHDNQSARRKFLQGLTGFASLGLLPRAQAATEDTLLIYNWDDYMGETTLADFTKDSGHPVQMDFFGDNDELFAKLRLGKSGYDLTFPSHDYVERMWRNNLLLKLDHDLLPNLVNLESLHQNPPYDPSNQHSVPYMWGSMGLAYRKSAIAPPTTWRDVLTVDGLKKSGRVAWLSEASSIYSVAAMMLGQSVNDYSVATMHSVFAELNAAKRELTVIAPDNGQDLLAAGEVDIAIEWNGDIAALIKEDDDIGFVFPIEGSLYVVDCLCIPADASHPQLAHEFINYVLRPDIGQAIAEYIGYATPNLAALHNTSTDYRNNPVTFPPPATKLETANYQGEENLRRLYKNWQNLLAL